MTIYAEVQCHLFCFQGLSLILGVTLCLACQPTAPAVVWALPPALSVTAMAAQLLQTASAREYCPICLHGSVGIALTLTVAPGLLWTVAVWHGRLMGMLAPHTLQMSQAPCQKLWVGFGLPLLQTSHWLNGWNKGYWRESLNCRSYRYQAVM